MPIPVPNSSTGGYLTPDSSAPDPYPPPLEGEALEDLFHDVVAGLIGFASDDAHNALVRVRWQVEPANMPPLEVDWVAFTIQGTKRDWDPYTMHDPDYYGPEPGGGGADITQQDQELELFLSYYGPNSGALQGRFEDGIKLAQNREALDALGIKFIGAATDAYRLPALLKERFRDRWDQKFKFRRRVFRVYPILNIASASATLDNEQYKETITVTPPSP